MDIFLAYINLEYIYEPGKDLLLLIKGYQALCFCKDIKYNHRKNSHLQILGIKGSSNKYL